MNLLADTPWADAIVQIVVVAGILIIVYIAIKDF